MSFSSSSMSPVTASTRREQRRAATLVDIRTAARTLLAEGGPDVVTLRGIAARLGMASAGVHYYYASRDELLTALVIDAFDDLARLTDGASCGRRTRKQAWTEAAGLSFAVELCHRSCGVPITVGRVAGDGLPD